MRRTRGPKSTENPSLPVITGTRLGRHEIRSQLGKGGVREVYMAIDMELDHTVAIKILPAELASDQHRMQRFIQEAKSASALIEGETIASAYEGPTFRS